MTPDKKTPKPQSGAVARTLPTVCMVVGLIAIPCGVALLSLPAGIIVAGSLCVIAGGLMTLGGGPDA